jgi:hypothetical protein
VNGPARSTLQQQHRGPPADAEPQPGTRHAPKDAWPAANSGTADIVVEDAASPLEDPSPSITWKVNRLAFRAPRGCPKLLPGGRDGVAPGLTLPVVGPVPTGVVRQSTMEGRWRRDTAEEGAMLGGLAGTVGAGEGPVEEEAEEARSRGWVHKTKGFGGH